MVWQTLAMLGPWVVSSRSAEVEHMALHGQEGQFTTLFPGSAIQSDMANLLAFTQIR